MVTDFDYMEKKLPIIDMSQLKVLPNVQIIFLAFSS